MVHLSYAFLAKSVEAKDGRFYTDGEGLESVEVSSLPGLVPLNIGGRLKWKGEAGRDGAGRDEGERDDSANLGVLVEPESGTYSFRTDFTVERNPNGEASHGKYTLFSVSLMVPVAEGGPWRAVVFVGEGAAATLPFEVAVSR